jgi:hypothetical protein
MDAVHQTHPPLVIPFTSSLPDAILTEFAGGNICIVESTKGVRLPLGHEIDVGESFTSHAVAMRDPHHQSKFAGFVRLNPFYLVRRLTSSNMHRRLFFNRLKQRTKFAAHAAQGDRVGFTYSL